MSSVRLWCLYRTLSFNNATLHPPPRTHIPAFIWQINKLLLLQKWFPFLTAHMWENWLAKLIIVCKRRSWVNFRANKISSISSNIVYVYPFYPILSDFVHFSFMFFDPFYPSYRPILSTLINFHSQPLDSSLWYLSSEIRWPPKVKMRCFALSFANQTGWIESYKYKYNFTTQWNWAWLGILSEPLEIKRLNRSPFDYRQKYKKWKCS